MGSQRARPRPPGSATSKPGDRAKSRRQPLVHSVPTQRVGVMLAPASAAPGLMLPPRAWQLLLSRSRHLPGACPQGHRGFPAASWPVVPAGEEQVLGAGAGWGQGWAWPLAEWRPNPLSQRKPDLPSLGTQSQHSGTWHRLRRERPCLGKAATLPLPASHGARPLWRSWRWERGMPCPCPHTSTGCPPPPQDTSSPGLHHKPVRLRPAGAPGILGLRVLGGPITDLVPACGLCTLTCCVPSQLGCHLLSSTPPHSRPPSMLT